VQIIAGRYRGRRITTAPLKDVRPCSSRVKKSIFDILHSRMDFEESCVLDLFAGFGSLGFETLSRGASRVTFVDRHPASLLSLRKTAGELKVEEMVSLVNEDVALFLQSETGSFDLIFADPPYAWEDYPRLIEGIMAGSLLEEDGWLLIEHDAHGDFSLSPYYSFHRDYGMTRITFFQH
jgi:16S rRNA (guanine966-N2)-methyltransferase